MLLEDEPDEEASETVPGGPVLGGSWALIAARLKALMRRDLLWSRQYQQDKTSEEGEISEGRTIRREGGRRRERSSKRTQQTGCTDEEAKKYRLRSRKKIRRKKGFIVVENKDSVVENYDNESEKR